MSRPCLLPSSLSWATSADGWVDGWQGAGKVGFISTSRHYMCMWEMVLQAVCSAYWGNVYAFGLLSFIIISSSTVLKELITYNCCHNTLFSWRGWFFLTFCSAFEELRDEYFDDYYSYTFVLKKY